jgi:hypothetical protein
VRKEHPKARPPGHTDAAKRVAKELADISGRLASIKGEAMNWLRDPNLYAALRLRIENAHASVEAAAVEARRRVRINEEDAKRRRYGLTEGRHSSHPPRCLCS